MGNKLELQNSWSNIIHRFLRKKKQTDAAVSVRVFMGIRDDIPEKVTLVTVYGNL